MDVNSLVTGKFHLLTGEENYAEWYPAMKASLTLRSCWAESQLCTRSTTDATAAKQDQALAFIVLSVKPALRASVGELQRRRKR